MFGFQILNCNKYDLFESGFNFTNVEPIPLGEKCRLSKPGIFLQMLFPGFASLPYFIRRKTIQIRGSSDIYDRASCENSSQFTL